MPVKAAPLKVPGIDRELEAFLALPEGPMRRRPAVIVVHEVFGPDAHIQDVAERFAREGYVALAPNLFTGEIQRLLTPAAVAASMAFFRTLAPEEQRDPAKIQARMAQLPPEDRAALAAMMQIQDPARQRKFGEELVRVAGFLRARDEVDPSKVAALGFCFGGGMAGRLAVEDPKLGGAVIFYGASPADDEVAKIRCPVLGLYGGEDRRITDTVPALDAAAKRHGVNFRYKIYPGAAHAFFNDTRPTYHADSARDAWPVVLGFLRESIGPAPPA
jgi:carboxymethylenebutenolidase